MPQEHCTSCGGNEGRDCGDDRFMECSNPCRVGPRNTPRCESLPSQIENFTLQFFGTVVKTEVQGEVVWSLPCNLGVGLPNNPRGVDEGLACYFLRLFADGIIGLTGPAGKDGSNGAKGNNAYSVTVQAFNQPSGSSPLVQVVISENPAILQDLYLFVDGSGWYQVNDVEAGGVLFLQLVKAVANAPTQIPAGALVIPSGFPGASFVGPQGPQGVPGPAGPASTPVTNNNGFYFATVGSDFSLPNSYQAVNFTNSSPNFLATVPGVYMVTVVATVTGGASVATTDTVSFKLRNTSDSADAPGSSKSISNLVPDQVAQVVISAMVTTGSVNQTIALFGQCSAASHVVVNFDLTTIAWVRIS